MPQFFQTVMGKLFYDRDIPKLVKSLHDISNEMSKANELKEAELKLMRQRLDLDIEMMIRENKIATQYGKADAAESDTIQS